MNCGNLCLSLGLALASLLSGPFALAQQPSVDDLKKDIEVLKETQRAIQKDIQEIRNLLQKGQPVPPSTAAPAPGAGYDLDAHRRETLVDVLQAAPPGSPAWIVATAVDLRAVALSKELAAAFTQAGWRVRSVKQTEISVRAGLFLFAGKEVPPTYVATAQRALEAAGLSPTYSTGYRDYYNKMVRTRPGFKGFKFAKDQTFVLVVGRAP